LELKGEGGASKKKKEKGRNAVGKSEKDLL